MTDVERRWPRKVFGSGEEPDPRFSLANERTFLAWIRTAVGLGAAGVALSALDLHLHTALAHVAALIFIAAATVMPALAWLRWREAERALRHGRALPDGLISVVVVVVVSVVCLLVFIAVALA